MERFVIDGLDFRETLALLDKQRQHCKDNGATLHPRVLYVNHNGNGDDQQNAYYNGHCNAVTALLMFNNPPRVLLVDENDHHYIDFLQGGL